jgi:3-oxoacyl-[acyl-carrier protein] reductase
MEKRVMNKTVFITGASGSIGKDIAIAFGLAGWRVALGYCKGKEKALQIKKLLEENNIEAEIFYIDLSDFSSIPAVVSSVVSRFGKIDALINNAATEHYSLFTDTTKEDYSKVFDINVGGTILLTKEVVSDMLKRRDGSIVNISSVWGMCGAAGEVLYSASKAALLGFTKALAKEMAGNGIRVNSVSPGVIDTPMIERFSEEEKAELIEKTPLGRLGKGQDVAETVLFLCNSKSDFITGQNISPNGGFLI